MRIKGYASAVPLFQIDRDDVAPGRSATATCPFGGGHAMRSQACTPLPWKRMFGADRVNWPVPMEALLLARLRRQTCSWAD